MHDIQHISESLFSETGIDIRSSYCSITGKPIGTHNEATITDTLISIGDCDFDDCLSDLLIRTLASSRPSPAWNKIQRTRDGDSMARLIQHDPSSTLSYLLGRLFRPAGTLSSSELLNWTHIQIHLYINADHCFSENKPLANRLMLALLEIDAKYNLANHNLSATIQRPSDYSRPITQCSNPIQFVESIEAWAEKLNQAREKALAAREASDRSFRRGNSKLKVAYLEELMRQLPASQRTESVIKKNAMLHDLGQMFDELEAAAKKPSDSGKPSRAAMQDWDAPRKTAERLVTKPISFASFLKPKES